MKKRIVPQSPLPVAAVQLGLLVLAIYYTFIGGQTAQGIFDHYWRQVTLWLTAFLAGGWLLWRLAGKTKIPRTPLDYPLLFLVFAWYLATAFSINVVYSRESLVFFIIYLLFFYMAADFGRRPWVQELVFNAVIGVSGLVWTLALLQLSWWYQGRIPAPEATLPRLSVLGNPNTMAGFIALVIPIVLYKLTRVQKRTARILLGGWLVMLAASALLTQSRGGILGGVVAGGGYLGVWLAGRGHTFSRRWLPAAALLAGMVVLAGVVLAFRGVQAGVDVRQQVAGGAIKTLLHHPVLGAGPGTLGQALILYQQPLDTIWADAHNLPLTLIAETGLVGAAGLVWLAVAGFRLLVDMARRGPTSRTPGSLACAAALPGFVVHNLVDSLFKFPVIMLLVAVWAGFWVSGYTNAAAGKPWPKAVVAAAAVILAATTLMGLRDIQHIAAYNRAVEAAGRDNWLAALDELEQASQLAPQMPFYQRQLGFVAGYLSAQEPAYREQAINSYRAALAQVNRLPADHANLACLLWRNGRPNEAIQEMGQALRLQPGNVQYRLNLGLYLEQTGQIAPARAEYAGILASRPELVTSTFWRQTEPRAAELPAIIGQAAELLVDAPARQVNLYLYAGNPDAARQVYRTYSRNEPSAAALRLLEGKILLAQGQPAAAKAAFEAAVQAGEQTGEVYLWLSRAALENGDAAAAVEFAGIARRQMGDYPEVLYQAGLAAAANGLALQAGEYFERAFTQLTDRTGFNSTRYATEVARRRPLPAAQLPCLAQIYPTQLLVDISRAGAGLLEARGDDAGAVGVYRRLLIFEPDLPDIAAELDRLCQQNPPACDFRAK